MSARKNQTNLNLSGFSPIQLNTGSPSSYKSPAKDYGINERIETGKDKIVSGYDRWNLATMNGSLCINIIHNIKEKARRSNESVYPEELGNYCKKMQAVRAVLIDEINSLKSFKKEMTGSLAILDSMSENEVLKTKLETVQTFFTSLLELYEANFDRKSFVIENIAHTTSSTDSHLLITCWNNDPTMKAIFQLITQLKISPPDHRWVIAATVLIKTR